MTSQLRAVHDTRKQTLFTMQMREMSSTCHLATALKRGELAELAEVDEVSFEWVRIRVRIQDPLSYFGLVLNTGCMLTPVLPIYL